VLKRVQSQHAALLDRCFLVGEYNNPEESSRTIMAEVPDFCAPRFELLCKRRFD